MKPTETISGTLIVAMYCQEGLVIRADKRNLFPNGSYDDNADKLLYCDSNLVVTVTGGSIILGPWNSAGRYDVLEVISEYLLEHDFDGTLEYFANLRDRLGERFYQFWNRFSKPFWPKESDGVQLKVGLKHNKAPKDKRIIQEALI